MRLFDIQVNGFAGVDFQQRGLAAGQMRRAVEALAAHDTGKIFATLITDAIDELAAKLADLERIRAEDALVADVVCGYHLEGPWLSPEPGYCGAHDPQFMSPPDLKSFDALQEAAGGRIRLVTLAPELPGSREFIRHLRACGVEVSLGHTNASMGEIEAAIEAGARFCTHLGNGVPAQLPRHNNIIQRLLSFDELTAFFIPDGIHLPPYVLGNLFRAKPPGKALFATDCMSAAGALPGRYTLGRLEVEVGADRVVRQPGGSNFAGSSLAADDGVANLVRWLGLPPSEARAHFSTLVAREFPDSAWAHGME